MLYWRRHAQRRRRLFPQSSTRLGRERAVEFGIDLTLTLENLRLTPKERIRKLDNRLAAEAKSKVTEHYRQPKDLLMLIELEAIQEYQQLLRSNEN